MFIQYGQIDMHPSCSWRILIDGLRVAQLPGEFTQDAVEQRAVKLAIKFYEELTVDDFEKAEITIERW
jgi:hypothetical protein